MPDEQRHARLEWRRAKDAQGIIARWDEIPAERLVHGRHWSRTRRPATSTASSVATPATPSRSAPTTFETAPGMLEPTRPAEPLRAREASSCEGEAARQTRRQPRRNATTRSARVRAGDEYLYEARLLPIGQPVRIPEVGTGRRRRHTFDDRSFELERTAKTKPEIWMTTTEPYESARSWRSTPPARAGGAPTSCSTETSPTTSSSTSGSPCQVGLERLKIGSGEPFLREISIVPRGAVKGAEVTSRDVLEPPPVKPAVSPTSSPAAVLRLQSRRRR